MKQVLKLTLLLMAIPFFVVLLLFVEEKKEEKLEPEEKQLYVRVKRESTDVIDNVELETYVKGVLAGEMPISFHLEALKAQAVAARSYVLKRMENNKNSDYDVVDSVTNQVYLDDDYLKGRWQTTYEEKINKLTKAVLETKGEYISYNGTIADALFFSTSNGFTENSEDVFSFETPYLKKVESSWDEETSPVFKDEKKYKADAFFDALSLPYSDNLNIEVIEKSDSGRIVLIKINGVEMKGTDVRSKLGLRSTDFEMNKNDNSIIIKTSGYGHGVGMSQYGALGMANEGYTYDEILKYYYKGVEIKELINN